MDPLDSPRDLVEDPTGDKTGVRSPDVRSVGGESSALPNSNRSFETDSGHAHGDEAVGGRRLVDHYRLAWADFWPSRSPCVYKSGQPWPTRDSWKYRREPRTIHRPDIAPVWVQTLERFKECLDKNDVRFSNIIPLGWAEEGVATPFCPFLLQIGVLPRTLAFVDAVRIADDIKEILVSVGLPEVEVALIEQVSRRHAVGRKRLEVNTISTLSFPEIRKEYGSFMGFGIATERTSHFEGSGGIFLQLDGRTDVVSLLTCAHVIHPPTATNNVVLSQDNASRRKDIVIAPGDAVHRRAIDKIRAEVRHIRGEVEVGARQIADPELPEDDRARISLEIQQAPAKLLNLDLLDAELSSWDKPAARVLGNVRYVNPIVVDVGGESGRLGFTEDWGIVDIDSHAIDKSFKGNMLYFGDTFKPSDFAQLMCPRFDDRSQSQAYHRGVITARGIVSMQEIRQPSHQDADGLERLFVVKSGIASGTTIGMANGLECVKRTYTSLGIIEEESLEIPVVRYSNEYGAFSKDGDSGSIVLTRDGMILGMLTAGAGPTDSTDVSFLTPFCWLLSRIKIHFPDVRLYNQSAI